MAGADAESVSPGEATPSATTPAAQASETTTSASSTMPAPRTRATTLVTAKMPPSIIERSMGTPSLFANIGADKFHRGLPLFRKEEQFAAEGLPIGRDLMCRWLEDIGGTMGATLVHAMRKEALATAFCILTDSTHVLVQPIRTHEKNKSRRQACTRGHFVVQIADRDHVFFEYTARETSVSALEMFRGFSGYVQADANSVHDILFRDHREEPPEDAPPDFATRREVGCWSHGRTKFWEAAVAAKEPLAREALFRIHRLFVNEQKWKGVAPAQRKVMRDRFSRPEVEAFFGWVEAHWPLLEHQRGLLRTAFGYARNQKDALTRFLEDGRLEMTNNRSERENRRIATGRKAWLFVGSDDHAQSSAAWFTVIASAKLHGLGADPILTRTMRESLVTARVFGSHGQGSPVSSRECAHRARAGSAVQAGRLEDGSGQGRQVVRTARGGARGSLSRGAPRGLGRCPCGSGRRRGEGRRIRGSRVPTRARREQGVHDFRGPGRRASRSVPRPHRSNRALVREHGQAHWDRGRLLDAESGSCGALDGHSDGANESGRGDRASDRHVALEVEPRSTAEGGLGAVGSEPRRLAERTDCVAGHPHRDGCAGRVARWRVRAHRRRRQPRCGAREQARTGACGARPGRVPRGRVCVDRVLRRISDAARRDPLRPRARVQEARSEGHARSGTARDPRAEPGPRCRVPIRRRPGPLGLLRLARYRRSAGAGLLPCGRALERSARCCVRRGLDQGTPPLHRAPPHPARGGRRRRVRPPYAQAPGEAAEHVRASHSDARTCGALLRDASRSDALRGLPGEASARRLGRDGGCVQDTGRAATQAQRPALEHGRGAGDPHATRLGSERSLR
ncbi:MAG: IS66 family transposase [Actinobacteria bacterium]|nr:IS66 family transposase [Actinomycetota bacterium]